MPKLTVIRASAGSGKTFRLTQEYLRLILLNPGNFRHILAVTFTNKATEEMKSRIVKELFRLSAGKESRQLNPLVEKTGMTEAVIREKAGKVLRQLLHQYSWFSVNTIDTFFQRIIRNFTRELGIPEGYVIELESEPVLTEIINRLLVNAEHDATLLKWLTMFATALIEKGENWNLKKSIRKLGGEIFSEEFKNLDPKSISHLCDRKFMGEYREKLFKLQKQIQNTYREFGIRAMDIIKSHGLSVDDFSRKRSGPAGYFAKVSEGDFSGPSDAVTEAIFNKDKWYTRTSTLKNKIEDLAVSELMPLLERAKKYFDENHVMANTSEVILKNLFTLGILIDLSQLSDEWCSENNTFLLPEAPVFLNKIIDGNDTPFIYEKAGFWFHHFMIDEFQDTSVMQWNNFKPLISNSLSQDYDNLVVGDIKQSIYRWRNSNWEILENRIITDFLPGVIKPVVLNENRRSRENLVNFNNNFFKQATQILQKEFESILQENSSGSDLGIQSITGLYRDMEQIPARDDRDGGYVSVKFVNANDDNSFYDDVNREVIELLYDLLDKGYRLQDIAVLTRKNKEAADLADFILKNRENGKMPLSVISDEALLIGSSVVVNTLISLLKNIVDPGDHNNNFYLNSVVLNYLDGKVDGTWMDPGLHRNALKLPEEFVALAKGVKSFSLAEISEQLIRIFKLDSHEGEMVYLMAFRDLVQEYLRSHSSDLVRFIEFWEETGCKRSVAAPAGQDALRIMTLHKSKGLEFRITIIPYCTWELNTFDRSFLWGTTDREPFNQLPVIPVAFTRKLAKTVFSRDYFRELHKQFVDNLNLTYVAFTRACDAMYIFCKENKNDKLGNVSALAQKILADRYETGSLPPAAADIEKPGCETIKYQPSQNLTVTSRLKVAFQGTLAIDPEVNKPAKPVNEGRILHEIFNLIHKREDIRKAVSLLHLQGKISLLDQQRYVQMIENAMNDLQVSTWFAGDWKILTEAEIIVPKGEIKRPDRVMFRDGQTLIIDFKFGLKPDKVYEQQVREYAQLLKDMGYSSVEGYLWYVRLGKVIYINL